MTVHSAPSRVVFSDFDGTISDGESFAAMLRTFTPDLARDIVPRVQSLEIPLKTGVRQMLESIPASRLPEIVAWTRRFAIRPGFAALLDFLDKRGVRMVVVSGGIMPMVRELLAPYWHRLHAVYALELDLSSGVLVPSAELQGEQEMVDKCAIMDRHPADQRIAIGDAVTDLRMAQHADVVFARDMLCEYLDERRVGYERWTDFFEVRDRLDALWA
jgi:2-hydroxy-3-keto-5-methylthiopentenyl-1-phosphate phosphatase